MDNNFPPLFPTIKKMAGALVILFFTSFGSSISVLAQDIPIYGYKVLASYPHDPNAFTQGLIVKNGYLYEGTGLYKQSTIRKVELKTGKIIQKKKLPPHIFGEGITDWNGTIIGITWKNKIGYIWDINSFKLLKQFRYSGEGWGITHNETHLIKSDGTSTIEFLDPLTLEKSHQINVTANGTPIDQLNELEWVNGEIYANIWQTDLIARIDPNDGKVLGWIDLSGLLTSEGRVWGNPDVLNGIAVDDQGRLYVTGKKWPKVFEIEIFKK